MNIHSIDIESIHRPDELVRFFEDNEVKQGDTVKIITDDDKNALMMMGLILIILIALVFFFDSNKSAIPNGRRRSRRKKDDDGEKILDDLFKGKSVEEIEREVENEYGVRIEVEQREDEEHRVWRNLSAKNFLKGYGEIEPDYNTDDIKEPNPRYQSKWKGK